MRKGLSSAIATLLGSGRAIQYPAPTHALLHRPLCPFWQQQALEHARPEPQEPRAAHWAVLSPTVKSAASLKGGSDN